MTECDQGGAIFVTVVRESLSAAEVVSEWRPEGELPGHWSECRMAEASGLYPPFHRAPASPKVSPRGVSRVSLIPTEGSRPLREAPRTGGGGEEAGAGRQVSEEPETGVGTLSPCSDPRAPTQPQT